jgi:antitoxin (DNA-binding transcriptional repressor) of toxin-antitoxin stability system
MRELDGGETFIVTRDGVPVAELTPLRRRRFLSAETAVARFRSAPAVDGRRFRDDLDAVAAPRRRASLLSWPLDSPQGAESHNGFEGSV